MSERSSVRPIRSASRLDLEERRGRWTKKEEDIRVFQLVRDIKHSLVDPNVDDYDSTAWGV